MKRIVLALALLCAGFAASAQSPGLIAPGSVLGNPTGSKALAVPTQNPVFGLPGSVGGTAGFAGSSSGKATIGAQSVAGTPFLTLPNTSGTFAVGASSPLILDSGTGNLTCPTCTTGSGGALTNGSTTTSGYTSGQILSSNGTVLSAYSVTGTGNAVLSSAPSIASPAINGGTITGLPNPTNGSDAATKNYVDGASAGLHVLAPSRLSTAAVLPNTPTYNNGSSGVGATLTAGTNSTLTVDSTVANLNDVILVQNQASAFQNGIYTVTTAGSGSAAWVLTRATYFNTSANMIVGSYTTITAGSANANKSYALAATVTTVGTTSVLFNLFSNNVALPGGSAGQLQYNNAGVFGGFTASGDATINTSTGVVTVTKVTPPGGSTAQLQYNNSGVFAGFTASGDATITPSTGAVSVTKLNGVPVNPASSTTNDVLAYNGTGYIHQALISLLNTICTAVTTPCVSFFGYANIKWFSAVCNGSVDDTTTLQAALNFMHTNFGGGNIIFPPGSSCIVNTGPLLHPAGVWLIGSSIDSTSIATGVDETVIQAQTTGTLACSGGGLNGGISNITVFGYTGSATTPAINVGNNCVYNIYNSRVWHGTYGLQTAGSDGTIFNSFICGHVGCVNSSGSNWYERAKLDGIGGGFPSTYGFVQGANASGLSVAENKFINTDLSCSPCTYSLYVDDATNNSFTNLVNSVFDGQIFLNHVKNVVIVGGVTAAAITINNGSLMMSSTYALTTTTIGGAGGKLCPANSNANFTNC